MTMQTANGLAESVQNGPFILDGSALTDPTKQAQVYQYLESLKGDADGWRRSADNIVTNNVSSIEEHFLLLQVIEDFLMKRYQEANENDVATIRSFLSHWMKKISSQSLPAFLVNKMAHIFSLVFAADFPTKWPRFMQEVFLERGISHLPTVSFYLKTLLAIDSEVVDKDIERTRDMTTRNTKIKDVMREVCIEQCANTWCQILEQVSDTDICSQVLDVVAAYVDWIDVELVANDRFVPLLVRYLGNTDTSESAISCVEGLVQKGMPAAKKLTLVIALMNVMNGNNLLTVTSDTDEDDVERAGSLISIMGHQLIECRGCIEKEGGTAADASQCISNVKQLLPAALVVFNNKDYELSQLTIDFLRDYVLLIRNSDVMEDISLMAQIVSIAITRFAMPNDLNPDGEGEEEIEFNEYRKQLKQLINPIGMKRAQLVIEPMEQLLNELQSLGSGMAVRKVEAIVQLVYALAEMIPANFPQSKDPWLMRAAALPLRLMESVPLDGRSSQVHLQYFENAARYDRILSNSPDRIVPHVAAAFLDERGISFRIAKVRTRIVYLFVRFVKAHKAVLSPLVSEVISRLAPLLAVSPQAEQFLTSEDQAFIFEATSTLIIFGNLEVSQKSGFIAELAGTLAEKFTSGLAELDEARKRGDVEGVQVIGQFLSTIVGYSSRMSKAFNGTNTMQTCQCVDIFLRLLNLFLSNLSPTNGFLLESTRQLTHRMVVCLEGEILPLLPSILNKLSQCSQDLDSMHHLLILSHQIVAKHKKAILESGVDFGAILSSAARLSVDPAMQMKWAQDETGRRALIYVQRSFCQLLLTVVASEMFTDLAPPNGSNFAVVVEAARCLCLGEDPSCQKQSLGSLCRIGIQVMQDDGGRVFESSVRTCLEVPALPHLNSQDAASHLVIHEVSSSLSTLRSAAQQPFDNIVTSLLPPQMGTDLLTILSTMKGKDLDKHLNMLYTSIRATLPSA